MYLLCSISLVLLLSKLCFSERRILNGSSSVDKPYMVYIVKMEDTDVQYDAWLCGGVIVTTEFIVTSAACIEDVKYMYAIAGYKEYINGKDIYENSCTNKKKKKIVMTCVPLPYQFDYPDITKWANMDIGVVKVESPYDFEDTTYVSSGCSYTPSNIDFSGTRNDEAPGKSAVVFGWGHTKIFRKPENTKDLNQKLLQYSPVKIVEKSVCKKVWPSDMSSMIDRYMICTFGAGNLDDQGNPWTGGKDEPERVMIDGCDSRRRKTNLKPGEVDPCDYWPKPTLRGLRSLHGEHRRSRRHGFCQNDHGGPLIGFSAKKKEILVGVQSAFLLDEENNCQGPFLHTSTFCNSKFLNCIIFPESTRRACDNALRMGFSIIRRMISWKDHPDGPAANERHPGIMERKTKKDPVVTESPKLRPVISLHDLYKSSERK